MLWPALYGVLTPVCMEVSDGLKILHSTLIFSALQKLMNSLKLPFTGIVIWQGKLFSKERILKKLNQFCTLDGEVQSRMIRDKKIVLLIHITAINIKEK